MFNEICINEEMLPKYTYIYIYIYIYIDKSYWKSMTRIEIQINHCSPKKPSGIRTCNYWRMEKKSQKDLFKSLQKLKTIAANYF